jgi:hypothetical protein
MQVTLISTGGRFFNQRGWTLKRLERSSPVTEFSSLSAAPKNAFAGVEVENLNCAAPNPALLEPFPFRLNRNEGSSFLF